MDGTRRLLELAERMWQLIAFVHVSTAFAHCYVRDHGLGRKVPEVVEEKLYPEEELLSNYTKV